jgi:hypothetical protein
MPAAGAARPHKEAVVERQLGVGIDTAEEAPPRGAAQLLLGEQPIAYRASRGEDRAHQERGAVRRNGHPDTVQFSGRTCSRHPHASTGCPL